MSPMTDERIYEAIMKSLADTPKMPVHVSDMNDHEREFFNVISHQAGMLLFLQGIMADRLRAVEKTDQPAKS